MQQNESAPARKEGGSQTTIKAFGVEFSGPSWVALIFIGAVIMGGIIYLAERDNLAQTSDQPLDASSSPTISESTGESSEGQASSSAPTEAVPANEETTDGAK